MSVQPLSVSESVEVSVFCDIARMDRNTLNERKRILKTSGRGFHFEEIYFTSTTVTAKNNSNTNNNNVNNTMNTKLCRRVWSGPIGPLSYHSGFYFTKATIFV